MHVPESRVTSVLVREPIKSPASTQNRGAKLTSSDCICVVNDEGVVREVFTKNQLHFMLEAKCAKVNHPVKSVSEFSLQT